MENAFAVFYEHELLVIIANVNCVLPTVSQMVDWYAHHYAFDRAKLTGCYIESIDAHNMTYKEFVSGKRIEKEAKPHV